MDNTEGMTGPMSEPIASLTEEDARMEPSGYGWEWPRRVDALMLKVDEYAQERESQAQSVFSRPNWKPSQDLRAEIAAELHALTSRPLPGAGPSGMRSMTAEEAEIVERNVSKQWRRLSPSSTEAVTREPDGWLVIFHDLNREFTLDRDRAEACAAQGYRVRSVYFGTPPASQPVASESDERVAWDAGTPCSECGEPWIAHTSSYEAHARHRFAAAPVQPVAETPAALRERYEELVDRLGYASVAFGACHKDREADLLAKVEARRAALDRFFDSLLTPSSSSTEQEEAFSPLASLPGESKVGSVIRAAVGHDAGEKRFYLMCSVGELAQRVCRALSMGQARSTGSEEQDNG